MDTAPLLFAWIILRLPGLSSNKQHQSNERDYACGCRVKWICNAANQTSDNCPYTGLNSAPNNLVNCQLR